VRGAGDNRNASLDESFSRSEKIHREEGRSTLALTRFPVTTSAKVQILSLTKRRLLYVLDSPASCQADKVVTIHE
jgi:hypothetical protein